MTLTASDVASLTSWLSYWEYAEYTFSGLVAVACVGEYIADFTTLYERGGLWTILGPANERKDKLAKVSTLLLIAALAAELVCLVRTNQLSGQVVGSLDDRATEASGKSTKAIRDATTALGQSGTAKSTAEKAEEISAKAVGESAKADTTASSAVILADTATREVNASRKEVKELTASEIALRQHIEDIANPRHISPEGEDISGDKEIRKERYKELRKYPGTRVIIQVNRLGMDGLEVERLDPEALALACDIAATLQMAGWNPPRDVVEEQSKLPYRRLAPGVLIETVEYGPYQSPRPEGRRVPIKPSVAGQAAAALVRLLNLDLGQEGGRSQFGVLLDSLMDRQYDGFGYSHGGFMLTTSSVAILVGPKPLNKAWPSNLSPEHSPDTEEKQSNGPPR